MSASAPLYESYWPDSFQQHANDALVHNAPYRGETQWWKYNSAWEKAFRKAEGIPTRPSARPRTRTSRSRV